MLTVRTSQDAMVIRTTVICLGLLSFALLSCPRALAAGEEAPQLAAGGATVGASQIQGNLDPAAEIQSGSIAQAQEGETGQEGSPDAAPVEIDQSLEQARAWIKAGEYDRATEILKAAIAQARGHMARLQEAYLLLAQTYIYRANYFRSQPQGRETSELYYREARDVVLQCLRTEELRHTVPDPPSEYPPEMIALFAEVRSQIFGSFRVIELNPPSAIVIMDGDTLRALPGETALGDVNLPIGPHLIVATRDGYRNYSQEITISPNSTLEQSIHLSKKRGPFWYASRVGVAAAGITAIAIVSQPEEKNPEEPQPLPEPPPPPSER